MRKSNRPEKRQTYVILDMAALGHVARCSPMNRGFSRDPQNFAVIEYILGKVIEWSQTYQTNKFLFCFDGGDLYRKKMFAGYKEKRSKKQMDEQDRADLESTYAQLDLLRKHIFPALGFKNIYYHSQLEGDDLFATLVTRIQPPHRVIMLANDHDLFQLLRPHIEQHWPCRGKRYDMAWFDATYKITTEQFVELKAVAGCSTDEVPGCKGIGEGRMLKYLRKEELGRTMVDRIVDFMASKEGKASDDLVRLPLPIKEATHAQAYMADMTIVPDDLQAAELEDIAQSYFLRGISSADNPETDLLFKGSFNGTLF